MHVIAPEGHKPGPLGSSFHGYTKTMGVQGVGDGEVQRSTSVRAAVDGGCLRRSAAALRVPLSPAESAAFIDSKIHISCHILASLKLDCVLLSLAPCNRCWPDGCLDAVVIA